MKQRIKQFLLTVALRLTLAVLIPSSVFAKINQKVLGSAEQSTKKSISTIMSFNEAMLQNYIDQFEVNGETKIVDGLESWQTVRGDVDDVIAADDAVAKEVDDDNILATAEAHCGGHEVATHPGYQVSGGDIAELNFSKAETLGEGFESAGLNLIIGMGIVSAILIFIVFLINRFKYIHDWVSRREAIEKEKREYKEKVATIQRMPKSAKNVSKRISAEQVRTAQVSEGIEAQCISVPKETVVESESIPAETVAVLAAAVAVSEEPQLDSQTLAVLTTAAPVAEREGPGPDDLVVRSLRRCGNSKRRRH